MHALIENNTITALRTTPSGGAWEDDQWLDFTDPAVLSEWEERHGWTPVTLPPRPADTDTVKHDEKVELVDGVPTQTWTARPWNAAELAERDRATTVTKLAADTTADEAKITQAIEDLRILLGDNTTVGSLRAWKQPITNGATLTGAQGKALADLIITQAKATRRVARQTLRLARLATGDYDSADVGTDA